MGHVARLAAAALVLAGCSPAAPAAAPCPGTAEGAIAALPLPPHRVTGDFRHLLLTDAAKDFCTSVPAPTPAYFILEDRQQRQRYTRRGEFQLVPEGDTVWIRHVSGLDFSPSLAVPRDATTFAITPAGILRVQYEGSLAELGVILTATFPRPEALKALGDDVFEATPEAGPPFTWSGAMIGAPIVHQGKLATP